MAGHSFADLCVGGYGAPLPSPPSSSPGAFSCLQGREGVSILIALAGVPFACTPFAQALHVCFDPVTVVAISDTFCPHLRLRREEVRLGDDSDDPPDAASLPDWEGEQGRGTDALGGGHSNALWGFWAHNGTTPP